MVDHRFDNKNKDCLSDEMLTLWSQGLLSSKEKAKVESHIQQCRMCRDLLETLSDVKQPQDYSKDLPVLQQISAAARQMIKQAWENQIGTILLKVSNGVYGAVETTGRVLFASWLPDNVITRSDSSHDTSAVVIETTYRDIHCLIESVRVLENRHTLKAVFRLAGSGRPIDRTMFVLYDNKEEIESQMSQQGVVVFEDLPMGSYRLMITFPDGSFGHLDFHLVAT